MKTITLGELLNGAQCSQVERIIEQTEEGQLVRKLTDYLKQFRDELEAKGVLPEYLAWVLYAKAQGII